MQCRVCHKIIHFIRTWVVIMTQVKTIADIKCLGYILRHHCQCEAYCKCCGPTLLGHCNGLHGDGTHFPYLWPIWNVWTWTASCLYLWYTEYITQVLYGYSQSANLCKILCVWRDPRVMKKFIFLANVPKNQSTRSSPNYHHEWRLIQ